jgi:hypothetical protein
MLSFIAKLFGASKKSRKPVATKNGKNGDIAG